MMSVLKGQYKNKFDYYLAPKWVWHLLLRPSRGLIFILGLLEVPRGPILCFSESPRPLTFWALPIRPIIIIGHE
jgi:hypothetical protein